MQTRIIVENVMHLTHIEIALLFKHCKPIYRNHVLIINTIVLII